MKFKSKQPAIENWTKFKIDDERDIERYFVEPINIGILTGKPSNNLIDVDIDHPGALKFAPYFLPETYCIFGRASKPRSHWVYRVPHPGNRMSFAADSMIVEVRGNGCCTLFPESIHPSGEKVEFVNPKDFIPDRSTWARLTQATKQIAIATVLYPYWSEESHCRHGLALALTAFLARREWKQENISKLIGAIAKEANDDEPEDRLRCVDDTFAAYAQGKPISGDEELVQLLGVELVGHIEKWVSGKASKKRKNPVLHLGLVVEQSTLPPMPLPRTPSQPHSRTGWSIAMASGFTRRFKSSNPSRLSMCKASKNSPERKTLPTAPKPRTHHKWRARHASTHRAGLIITAGERLHASPKRQQPQTAQSRRDIVAFIERMTRAGGSDGPHPATRLHHAARRCGCVVATRGACAAGDTANDRVPRAVVNYPP
jgi:hypothetical protein